MAAAHSVREVLGHIVEAAEDIAAFTQGLDSASFAADRKTRNAVVRSLEVIGEAARNLQRHHPEFVLAHPELPLRAATGMRNALIHGYFEVDWPQVWETVGRDIPALQSLLRPLLEDGH
ncbi:DUF86 domain-containing protein [Inhella sp.]|uniref:HepT-like ribonuclease domain-containing protein n=1 Tax=Inhella sp. TaxID=1921806 RepID=UPI0035AE81C3